MYHLWRPFDLVKQAKFGRVYGCTLEWFLSAFGLADSTVKGKFSIIIISHVGNS